MMIRERIAGRAFNPPKQMCHRQCPVGSGSHFKVVLLKDRFTVNVFESSSIDLWHLRELLPFRRAICHLHY